MADTQTAPRPDLIEQIPDPDIVRDWLRQEALDGRLPCLRIGRKLVFNLTAMEQALAEGAAVCREVRHAEKPDP